jgi:RNA polymerase sigma-32 factor
MENLNYQYESKERTDNLSGANTKTRPTIRSQNGGRNTPSRDHLHIYLTEIGRYEQLTREQEVELAERVRDNDDEDAMDRLITSNLRLVVKIAKDYNSHWRGNLLDLIQEGNLGLLQAVRKYDPKRGIKFSYYASFWIKAYILKNIIDNRKLVKIGTTQNQRKLFFRLAKERKELRAQGFEPDPKLVAKRLNVKEEEVVEMTQRLQGSEFSLDTPVSDYSNETYEAFLESPISLVEDRLSQEQLRVAFAEKLREFRGRLTEREADIYDNRIVAEQPLILQDLGDKYQISRERVRQIQKSIIKNIREWSKAEISNFEENYSNLMN